MPSALVMFFRNRRARKRAREALQQCRHLRNLREDLMRPADLAELDAAEQGVRACIRQADAGSMDRATEAALTCASRLVPVRSSPGLRENVEVIAVAVAVAMGFRTYILQPFKIPTGSMQPTLFGIHVENDTPAGLTDRLPLKVFKWAVTGEWHMELRAAEGGYVSHDPIESNAGGGTDNVFYIGGKRYRIPKAAELRFNPGQQVEKGALLWAGTRYAGDHVFVDKIRWNFRRPHRGEISVFGTDGIRGLPGKTHYIKRMSGLPGETVSIDPPNLVIDGKAVSEPEPIARIASRAPGYHGYKLVEGPVAMTDTHALRSPADSIQLGAREYFLLGDNTGNSRDGRYWGTVPQANLVGPAVVVYWPFSARWGLSD